MLCLGCDKEYRLLNKDMNIHVRPEQEVQLTYPSYLNAIYFYCVECRKTVKTQGISDENLAEYLIHREVREVLETLPSSSERKTFEAQTLAETVKEEREIHADAMKAMDR
ncbi:34688_t:CDS:1 [Gigaspora margarita]|uniref:34688_t:CDS:1 n=1 Tax=Gigaspora margarita TaxID=4874 RepID=A0ABN7UIF9_GIGMA|nr:34688_t:CDS:1 [Gigaspora margarita]